jgi:hypothetical protein
MISGGVGDGTIGAVWFSVSITVNRCIDRRKFDELVGVRVLTRCFSEEVDGKIQSESVDKLVLDSASGEIGDSIEKKYLQESSH